MEDGGHVGPFLVLELVEGPTLADRIAKGPLPLDEALPIAKQIAEALEVAHEAGVIHRDLKPANIKVREDGTVKVLDFGLAKALDTTPQGDPSLSPTLTAAAAQMGVIMGTAAYMSPEQARGKVVDRRADIWSFGAVLFEMLTGERPFVGEDVSLTLSAVLQREPEWALLPPTVPHGLKTYLRRCLQKDPRQRVQAIGDMRLAMEGAFEMGVSEAVAPATVAQPMWRRAVPLALTAAVAVIVGTVVWNLKPAPTQPSLPVSHMVVPLQADETILPSAIAPLALSPDGDLLVYAAQEGNDPERLYVRPMSSLEAQPLAGTEGGFNPFFSSDGQWVGFFAGRELKKVSITGGDRHRRTRDFSVEV